MTLSKNVGILIPDTEGGYMMYIAFLNMNGRIYFEECASREVAEEFAKKWVSHAREVYPYKEWRAVLYEVGEKTELDS